MKRADFWRGSLLLVRDGVDAGSRAIESIQKELGGRVFTVMRIVPGLKGPADAVQMTFDASVGLVHDAIRGVNQAAVKAIVDLLR